MEAKSESKVERSEAVQARDSVFPYTDIDIHSQKYWVDMLDNAQMVEDVLRSKGFPCPLFQQALTSFRLLEEMLGVRPADMHFVDCLSNGGAAALAAVCFGFGTITSIDISKRGKDTSKALLADLRKKGIGSKTKKVDFIDGAMQDFLPLEATLVFCNLFEQGEECFLDEGIVVQMLFDLSKRLITGALIVVLNGYLALDNESLKEMDILHIRCLQSMKRRGESDCNIWILQTMVPPPVPKVKNVAVPSTTSVSSNKSGSANKSMGSIASFNSSMTGANSSGNMSRLRK